MTTDIEDDWYIDWYKENEDDLKEAFIDNNEQKFLDYCKEQYSNYRDLLETEARLER